MSEKADQVIAVAPGPSSVDECVCAVLHFDACEENAAIPPSPNRRGGHAPPEDQLISASRRKKSGSRTKGLGDRGVPRYKVGISK